VDELTLKIRFAETDLAALPEGVAKTDKTAEIEEYKSDKKKLKDQYEDTLAKFSGSPCDIEKNKPEQKQ
jgi:hypothetical protein